MTTLAGLLDAAAQEWAAACGLDARVAARTSSPAGRALVREHALEAYAAGVAFGYADAMARGPISRALQRRDFDDLPPAQQAGMRCNDPAFQRFLGASDAADCAVKLRQKLGVRSRKDIDPDGPTGELWRQINGEFDTQT